MTRGLGLIGLSAILAIGCSNDDLAGSESPALTKIGQCTVVYTHFEVYSEEEYVEVQNSIISFLNDNINKITAGPMLTEEGIEVSGNCQFLQQRVLADVPHRFGYRTMNRP